MNFDDIKDQLIERLQEIWSKIRESESYILLKERYDSFNPNVQKVLQVSIAAFVLYFIYSIPGDFVTSANEHEEFFTENRQLTRDLIRAGRISRTTALPPSAPNYTSLQQQIDTLMTKERVLADQKVPPRPASSVAPASLVPKSITQTGIKVGAKKLNLQQTIRIAEDLSEINSSKLINIYIQADSKDPHYFRADYEVAAFSVPNNEKASTNNKKSNRKKSKFKKR